MGTFRWERSRLPTAQVGLAFPGACLAGDVWFLFVYFQLGRLRCCRVLVQQLWDDFCRIPKFFVFKFLSNCILKGVGQLAIPTWNGDAKRFERSMNYSFKPGAMARVLQLPHRIFNRSNEHFQQWCNELRLGKNTSWSLITNHFSDLFKSEISCVEINRSSLKFHIIHGIERL